MILDERNEFADSLAVTGAAATRNVGDTINLFDPAIAPSNRDVGQGQPMYVAIVVEAAPTGADTIEFHIVSDAQDPPAVDGTASEHYSSGAIAIADAPAGTRFMITLPIEGVVYEEFLGFQVTNVGAGALADLVVSAFLTLDPAGNKAYADALPDFAITWP